MTYCKARFAWHVAFTIASFAKSSRAQQVATERGVEAPAPAQWIQPSFDHETRPIWGHKDGIRIGLSPLPGPRGLLRVYTPYLHQPDDRPMNYIAVEPIPRGESHLALSELEFSRLDQMPGKRFEAVNEAGQNPTSESTPVTAASEWNRNRGDR